MQKQRSFHFRKIGKHIHHLISDGKHDRDHSGDDRESGESDNEGYDVSSDTEIPVEKKPGVSMHQQNSSSSTACLSGEGAAPKPHRPPTGLYLCL